MHRPTTSLPSRRARSLLFLATFATAWLTLDRLATSPPRPVAALVALASSAGIVIASETFVYRASLRSVLASLGLGSPTARAIAAAITVGSAIIATYVGGAALGGVHLNLRPNWPAVLVAALLFHGVAEELVWRGFVFGRLRRAHSHRMALLLSIPLIALTHVPIIIGNGWLVGTLAVATAVATCLPLSYLYERGDRTIWPAAIVHGSIGTWQIFDRTYPVQFKLIILLASIVVPLSAFWFGDRFFDTSTRHPALQPEGASR